MNRGGRIAWNMLLVAFVGFWAWNIITRVNRQLSDLDQLQDGPFKAHVIMIGLEDIGLLLGLAACAASLGSCFWQRVPLLTRCFFGCVFVALSTGTLVASSIQRADTGFVVYGDYVTFLGSVGFFLLPLILLGRGYPGLALCICAKVRRTNRSQSHGPGGRPSVR